MSNCVSRVTVCINQHFANVTKMYKPKQKKKPTCPSSATFDVMKGNYILFTH